MDMNRGEPAAVGVKPQMPVVLILFVLAVAWVIEIARIPLKDKNDVTRGIRNEEKEKNHPIAPERSQ